jgi:GST-like protein
MIDLYALTSPNVQKIYLALEELGLPYKEIFVDVWQAEQHKPEFLKVNPNAKVPAIVDHDGPGGKPYTVIESGAILMYLADKTGKLLPRDARKRFDTLQWMMVQMTSIGPMFGQWNHFKRFAPPGNDYAMSRYQTEARRLFDLLELRLGQSPYLGCDEYTVADVATWPWTRTHDAMGVPFNDKPNLNRWFNAIAERPAAKRVVEKIAAIKSGRDNAKPDDLDRFFGRGRYARP